MSKIYTDNKVHSVHRPRIEFFFVFLNHFSFSSPLLYYFSLFSLNKSFYTKRRRHFHKAYPYSPATIFLLCKIVQKIFVPRMNKR